MAITSNYNEAKFNRDAKAELDLLYQKIVDSFIYAAEEFIVNARGQVQDHAMGTYLDQTTNLRNSIGYYLFRDGELIQEKNEVTTNRAEIEKIINPKGFQLIVLAGMNYASYVESKGYNVISYQADVLAVDLTGYFENIGIIEGGSAARMEETFLP